MRSSSVLSTLGSSNFFIERKATITIPNATQTRVGASSGSESPKMESEFMTFPPEGQERVCHRHLPFGQGLYWVSTIGAVSMRALALPAASASPDFPVVRFPTAVATMAKAGAAMMMMAKNRCMLASTLMDLL
jgi:hypothetical protein